MLPLTNDATFFTSQKLTLPAKRHENGNLIVRGASIAKANHQITPGQDIAIAVFKNNDSYSISLSFKQETDV